MHSQDLARKAGLSTTRARSPKGGITVNTATYIGDEERRVFGKQVVIGGWRVVGGKSWTDVGKLGAYVVYDIDIELMDGGSINTLRRYSHFESLRSALVRRYPYLQSAIPLLPGKLHMTKFSPKFLEDRQIRLQRFLKAVVLHPEMGHGQGWTGLCCWGLDYWGWEPLLRRVNGCDRLRVMEPVPTCITYFGDELPRIERVQYIHIPRVVE